MAVLQVKALFMICLLVGHDAARMAANVEDSVWSIAPDATTDEVAFQEANSQCEWSTQDWQCYSKASSAEGMCAWRRLPWDFSLSESCRLTDEYMARPANRAKFFSIQAGVISAKSKKYADACSGSSIAALGLNRKCTRRLKHMMRAMKFMSKAGDDQLMQSVSPEQKEREQQLIKDSLKNLADAIGDDGSYVLTLQERLQADKSGLKRDPKGAVSNVVDMLLKLLTGSEEEKEDARQQIKGGFPKLDSNPLSAEEEAELDANNTKLAMAMRSEKSGTQDLIDKVDFMVPDNDTDTDTGSLMQIGSQLGARQTGSLVTRGLASFILTTFIVMLVVVMSLHFILEILVAIVAWLFISLLGCGMLSPGCFLKTFAFPFVAIGKAVRGTYNALSLAQLSAKGRLPPPTSEGEFGISLDPVA